MTIRSGRKTMSNGRCARARSTKWIISMFLCAASVRTRRCLAFSHEKTAVVAKERLRLLERKQSSGWSSTVCSATKIESDEEKVAMSKPSTIITDDQAVTPHVIMIGADYHGDFVNVTSSAVMVNDSVPIVSPEVTTTSNGATVAENKNSKRRSMWRRRKARSAEEGIRREKLPQLSSLLERAGAMEYYTQLSPRRHYAARTISGLIHALAEEAIDLEVHVDARSDTPLWEKQVDAVEIKFSRLSFKPLRIGGVDEEIDKDDLVVDTEATDASTGYYTNLRDENTEEFDMPFLDLSSADEAFRRIDADNSGSLDREEIIRALNMAAGCLEEEPDNPRSRVIQNIANELFDLYDINGDGVVDRSEYQSLVEDMAALSGADGERSSQESGGWFSTLYNGTRNYVTGVFRGNKVDKESKEKRPGSIAMDPPVASNDTSALVDQNHAIERQSKRTSQSNEAPIVDVSDSAEAVGSMAKSLGSITFSGLKLDLRRLIFGGVPVIKRITPGGPLILEPFTMTITGSFSGSDIMNSPLLDAGLRQLVALVLRRRMRSFRDLLDLAVLKGRDWTMNSAVAPVSQVTELSSVEFDENNKMVITGRAKIRTRPGAPTIEQAFKVRVKAGTRKDGRFIRLVEPELAFVLECPRPLEEGIGLMFDRMNLERPERPKPLYSFFPIYSPFKVDESDGFDLGDDNRIKKLYIEDGALKFEMKATLRPGRFLGNHYIAFSIPNRTFIITLDRVKEGIRSARRAKAAAKAAKASLPRYIRKAEKEKKKAAAKRSPPKSFFSRFVDGYLQAEREGDTDLTTPITSAIRDFFGKQGESKSKSD